MKKNVQHPESLMMSYGYDPERSEGAVKCPIFQTSTFVFQTAEEGKAFFELAYGLRKQDPSEEQGLIYSRINNPNLEILEDRLALWDKADDCAVFESGMSAISSVFLEFLERGDLLLYSNPLYGGTDHFIHHFLPKLGIEAIGFRTDQEKDEIIEMLNQTANADRLKMIYVESPANPTNVIVDLDMCKEIADHYSSDDSQPLIVVDNTMMGPLWQHPLQHGADLVLYSATKYIGGHSDLIAGCISGPHELIHRIKVLRTFLGNMLGPHTAWLLMRSLETLKVRMDQQARNAQVIAEYLNSHPKVGRVYYPGLDPTDTRQYELFKKQLVCGGAMIAFDVVGKEAQAFQFLNSLKLIKLAVSLGSTESLAEHPYTMTHCDVDHDILRSLNVSERLVRLSIGVENAEDIISDIDQALDNITAENWNPLSTIPHYQE